MSTPFKPHFGIFTVASFPCRLCSASEMPCNSAYYSAHRCIAAESFSHMHRTAQHSMSAQHCGCSPVWHGKQWWDGTASPASECSDFWLRRDIQTGDVPPSIPGGLESTPARWSHTLAHTPQLQGQLARRPIINSQTICLQDPSASNPAIATITSTL